MPELQYYACALVDILGQRALLRDLRSLPTNDEEKAKAAGLVLSADNGKLCEKCHNSESPTFKGFDFKKMWPKVEHKLANK